MTTTGHQDETHAAPLVSVIMANFNGAAYLADAIGSVQKQTSARDRDYNFRRCIHRRQHRHRDATRGDRSAHSPYPRREQPRPRGRAQSRDRHRRRRVDRCYGQRRFIHRSGLPSLLSWPRLMARTSSPTIWSSSPRIMHCRRAHSSAADSGKTRSRSTSSPTFGSIISMEPSRSSAI